MNFQYYSVRLASGQFVFNELITLFCRKNVLYNPHNSCHLLSLRGYKKISNYLSVYINCEPLKLKFLKRYATEPLKIIVNLRTTPVSRNFSFSRLHSAWFSLLSCSSCFSITPSTSALAWLSASLALLNCRVNLVISESLKASFLLCSTFSLCIEVRASDNCDSNVWTNATLKIALLVQQLIFIN